MSFWTDIRNTIESGASVVGNFVFPGSSILTDQLVSKGAQRELSSPLGQIAQLGSGIAGGLEGNLSNFGNLGNVFSTISGGGNAPVSELSFNAGSLGNGLGSAAGGNDFVQGAGFDPIAEQEMIRQQMQQGLRPSTNVGGGGMLDNVMSKLGLGGGGGGMGGAGSMPWGSGGNLMTMGTGLYGLLQSHQLQQMAKGLGQQADPFAAYRGQFGQQLSALSADPSSITKLPGYQAGLEAVQRSMAAQGYTGSGNMMAALAKYGGDFFQNERSQLTQLAGAQFNPAAGAQLNLQGQLGGAGLAINSLGLLGKGVAMAGG